MQKWEYLRVIVSNITKIDAAVVSVNGEKVGRSFVIAHIGSIVDKYLAELGEQGWELAGTVAIMGTRSALYFKRLKQ